MMNYSFSVVIPCRNEKMYIGKCIDSIYRNKYETGLIEVVVCDGVSNDGTLKILEEYREKYPAIAVLTNERQTTQYALNMGIEKSRNDVVFILGAHSELADNFFSTCNQILQEHADIMCVGGVLRNICEDGSSTIIAEAMSSPFGVGNAHFRTGVKDGEVDTVAFGCYRREVFKQIGLFDERLGRNQDDEFNYRLVKNRLKIWLTNQTYVKYYVRTSYKKLSRQYYQYGYWKVFVNKEHKTITTIRQLVPLLFVLFLITGAIASLIIPVLFIGYAAIIGLYLLMALIFAFKQQGGIKAAIGIVVAFLVLHISYGWGYLIGIIDFLLLRKQPSAKKYQLTR